MPSKFTSFMDEALKQAKIAFDLDEVPVGAVLVDRKINQIIAATHNQNITLKDTTAHAVILAIKHGSIIRRNQRLDDCDLYITLEPCIMCAAAISFARIGRVYYGASEPKFGVVSLGNKMFSDGGYFRPEFYSGIGEGESEKLLKEFFAKKR